jgi:monofunctional glycosyltransferase
MHEFEGAESIRLGPRRAIRFAPAASIETSHPSPRRNVCPTYRFVVDADGTERRPVWRRRLLIGVAGIAVLVTGVLAAAWITAPAPSRPKNIVLERLRAAGGRFVPLRAIPPVLQRAIVATEDERFYRHHGIDAIGLMRAVAYDASHVTLSQGGSTLTEQLAKVLYLGGNDGSPWRKLQDAAVALRLESELSKQQIMELYLNSVYFGDGAYGVNAASERYFGVAPSHLDLARASLLAGVIQDPSGYDPLLHPSLARQRQVQVLTSMVRDGYATEDQSVAALRDPLPLGNGSDLAPTDAQIVAPDTSFAGLPLAAGLTLLVVGFASLFVGRRIRRPLAFGLAAVVGIAAMSLIARSVKVA